jgi:diadenosine tetraphosphate (Ap4A) HIT family hydrolase
MTDFALDPRLAADTVPLGSSSLCLLLLMNEQRYPWLVLVPKRSGLSELFELTPADRVELIEESCAVAEALARTFRADKINVGALGNVVRQLHVHHVARRIGDPAWPGPVWGHSPREPYAPAALQEALRQLREALGARFAIGAPTR